MAKIKNQAEQRMIFKLNSKRLRRENWNIKLSIDEAFKNEELVSIADSQTIRFIYNIRNKNAKQEKRDIQNYRKQLKKIKKEPFSTENRKKIKQINKSVNKTLFTKDYVSIEFATIKDFDRACRGFFINGKKFKRIVGTPAGVKNLVIVFCSENIHKKLNSKITNGAKPIKIIPAKLEGYRSLTFSASTPVINTRNILVVKDWETHFKSDITQVGEDIDGNLYVESIKDADMNLEDSDGYGAISPKFSQQWSKCLGLDYISTAYVIRNSYCKGSLFTFDFQDFAKTVAHKSKVIDVWGTERDINKIDIIMPVSMLKLWKAYDSLEDYLDNCDKNGYTFSVTKVIPKSLENYRDMNYQFIQSLRLNDRQIRELIQPTIDEIHDVLGNDYRKTLLFLRGSELNDDNAWNYDNYDFVQALMIDKRMNDDPFVRQHVHRMIKKRIKEAKTGVIRVRGNFSIVCGDIYGFMEYIFGMKAKGLLKAGEFYNQYWNDKGVDKVTAFRAPQTTHENIRIMNLKNTEEMRYWYRYMPCCTIFNAWDCSCHTLNGAD